MNQFAPLFYFVTILLAFRPIAANTVRNIEAGMGVVVNVGAVIDNSSRIGKEQRVAMEMAMEDFCANNNQRLVLQIKHSQRDPMQAALAARDLINRQKVQAILGPHTWEETSLVAGVGSENHIPIVSFSEATPNWATELWPFLVQASHNELKQMEAVAAIVKSFEWYQVTVIYQDRDSSSDEILPGLSRALKQVGAEISQLVAVTPFGSSSLVRELEKLRQDQYRVVIVHLSLPLALQLFEKAKEMKMMEKDYVWITTDPITSLVHSFNASTISAMQGVIGVKSYFPECEGTQFQDFHRRFRKRFSSEYPEEENNDPGVFAAQAYDAARAVVLAVTQRKHNGRPLLENILQSDFHGLSGKIQFTDQKLPLQQMFQIINVIGKSYRELGYWSDGLGFTQTIGGGDTTSSSMKDFGPVFWPGGPPYTPKGWTVSTSSKPLRIGVPSGSTFKQYTTVEKDPLGNNFSFGGIAIDLFKETLIELPYHLPYDFFPFDGTYDSLVQQIHSSKFDAVVGDVAIVSRRYQYAEFTHPYSEAGLIMIVPVRSKVCNKAWLFMKPFTQAMWALIVAINVYNGFVVWLIERNYCPELRGSLPNQIGTLIWLSFTTLFSLHGEKLHSNLSRMTMVVWLFVALVITQTYTANLTSMLTVQQLEPAVADVDALLQSNAVVGYCKGSFVSMYLKEVLKFPPDHIKEFSSPKEYAKALKSKAIAAAFLEVPFAKIFLGQYCKDFVSVGPTFKVGGFGFAFPRGSPLLSSVNEAMLKVAESGKLRELENKMLASQKCLDAETDGRTPSLSPSSFWVLFIFSGGTSTIALLVYIFRIYKSMLKHKTVWNLMLAVINQWGNPSMQRFSRRDSDIHPETPTHSANVPNLQAQV
ncbi:glutamate receptor 2.8-like [Rosa sericea]